MAQHFSSLRSILPAAKATTWRWWLAPGGAIVIIALAGTLGANWLLLAILLLGVMGVSFNQWYWRKAVGSLETRLARQQTLLDELQARANQQSGDKTLLQTELGGAIDDLSATASDQAFSTARQVTAVVELNSLMTELSQAALQITQRSASLEQAARAVLNSTEQVAATTLELAQARDRGHQTVAATLASNQQVLQVYQLLNTNFGALSSNASQIRQILNLIENISKETHLLSLNASIEASGAGIYGERFGVVAREVKNLADKTHAAIGQIRQVVSTVDNSLSNAEQVMLTGEQATRQAFSIAQDSSAVIAQFESMVGQSVREAASIAGLAADMQAQATEISFALRLQQNSSAHALEALATVQRVAHSTAIAGEQISSSVTRLGKLSSNL